MEKVCKTRQLRQRTMEQMMFMMQPRKQLQLSALVSQLLTPKPPKKFPDEERELLTRREIGKLKSEAERIEEQNKRRDYTRLRKVEILQEEAHPTQVHASSCRWLGDASCVVHDRCQSWVRTWNCIHPLITM